MTSKRKFFRTVFTVTVLSEQEPSGDLSLSQLDYQITLGDWSGVVEKQPAVPIAADTAAAMLIEQGSDPAYFGLDESGIDLEP